METVSDCLPLSSLFTNMFLYMYIYRLFWPALAFSMKEYNLICLSTVAPRIISLPNVFQTTWHWAGCETWPGNVDTNNKNGPKNGKLGSEWIQMKFKKRELSVNHWPVWFFFFSFFRQSENKTSSTEPVYHHQHPSSHQTRCGSWDQSRANSTGNDTSCVSCLLVVYSCCLQRFTGGSDWAKWWDVETAEGKILCVRPRLIMHSRIWVRVSSQVKPLTSILSLSLLILQTLISFFT